MQEKVRESVIVIFKVNLNDFTVIICISKSSGMLIIIKRRWVCLTGHGKGLRSANSYKYYCTTFCYSQFYSFNFKGLIS